MQCVMVIILIKITTVSLSGLFKVEALYLPLTRVLTHFCASTTIL